MHTATEVPAPQPQKPTYTGLFREPVYPDGPYDSGDEDDVPEDAATITA
jgi:hypothetical protein